MSLKNDIIEMQNNFAGKMSDEIKKVFMTATKNLISSGIVERSLKTGDYIPDFTLNNAVGKPISINDLFDDEFLVINFYRGAWCPYCNLELRNLQKLITQIKKQGANLVAISPNLPDKSVKTIEKYSLPFEILSDVGNKIAKEFGIVFALDEMLIPIYESMKLDVPAHNGDSSYELPIPATYIVDSNRMIIHCFVNADYTKRMEPIDIVNILKNTKK